jgi:hypothetical protein
VIKLSESAWLCLSPEYIAHSVAASTRRLGAPPDVVLLHNPELILADLARRGAATAAAVDAFYEATLPRAFAALEAHPALQCYGLSANTHGCASRWWGVAPGTSRFAPSPQGCQGSCSSVTHGAGRWGALGGDNEVEGLDLERAVAAAAEAAACVRGLGPTTTTTVDDGTAAPIAEAAAAAVAAEASAASMHGGGGGSGGGGSGGGGGGGGHRCRVLQLPLNLLEPAAAAAPAAAARRLGLSVMAHRPLLTIPPPGAGVGFGVHRGEMHDLA